MIKSDCRLLSGFATALAGVAEEFGINGDVADELQEIARRVDGAPSSIGTMFARAEHLLSSVVAELDKVGPLAVDAATTIREAFDRAKTEVANNPASGVTYAANLLADAVGGNAARLVGTACAYAEEDRRPSIVRAAIDTARALTDIEATAE